MLVEDLQKIFYALINFSRVFNLSFFHLQMILSKDLFAISLFHY